MIILVPIKTIIASAEYHVNAVGFSTTCYKMAFRLVV